MLMGGRIKAGKDTVGMMRLMTVENMMVKGGAKKTAPLRSKNVYVGDIRQKVTKGPFKTSVKGHETHSLVWRESPWLWEYTHLMPRRELVSRTPRTAAEVALSGRLLTVSSLNRDMISRSLSGTGKFLNDLNLIRKVGP